MITAIIPARAGSTRLPNKNIAEINGEPLLVRKARQLHESGCFGEILVSSDSPDYLALVEGMPLVRCHLREPEHSDEKSRTFGETVAHLAGLAKGDVVAWTPCTAPLWGATHYMEAMDSLAWCGHWFNDPWSAIGCSRMQTYAMTGGKGGVRAPLNYDPQNHRPSQQINPVFLWSGALWVAPRASMIRWQYFHGPNPLVLYPEDIPHCDIDTEQDLMLARLWAKENG